MTYFTCRCDCGVEVSVQRNNLPNTHSCGCYRDEIKQKPNTLHENVFKSYVAGAVSRSYEFRLSLDRAKCLFDSDCHYCGTGPSNTIYYLSRGNPTFYTKRGKAVYGREYRYNGIDRVDNAKGYVEGNVVACCADCNRAKKCSSVEEFLSAVGRIQIPESVPPVEEAAPLQFKWQDGYSYVHYKLGAKGRGLTFDLTPGQVTWLVTQPCGYCKGFGRVYRGISLNGIDRVDSSVGYVFGNCMSCCWVCNEMKLDRSLKDFEAWVLRIQARRPLPAGTESASDSGS